MSPWLLVPLVIVALCVGAVLLGRFCGGANAQHEREAQQ